MEALSRDFAGTGQTVVRAHAFAMTLRQRKHCQSSSQCLLHPLNEIGETSTPFLHELASSLPGLLPVWRSEDVPQSTMHLISRFRWDLSRRISLAVSLTPMPGRLREIPPKRFA